MKPRLHQGRQGFGPQGIGGKIGRPEQGRHSQGQVGPQGVGLVFRVNHQKIGLGKLVEKPRQALHLLHQRQFGEPLVGPAVADDYNQKTAAGVFPAHHPQEPVGRQQPGGQGGFAAHRQICKPSGGNSTLAVGGRTTSARVWRKITRETWSRFW